MKIVSWNVRGLGSRKKRVIIRDFLGKHQPDIVIFQETKVEVCDRLLIKSIWGARHKRRYLTIWDERVVSEGETVEISNVARKVSEKLNGNGINRSMRDFDGFIRGCELVDPPLFNARFTWQEALPRLVSDHCPVMCESCPFRWGPTPFRFENMWLEHPSFKEAFEEWWNTATYQGWEGYKFMRKLKVIKENVKQWNREIFGNLESTKYTLEIQGSEIEALRGERRELGLKLEELTLREQIFWAQKVKVKWLKEGMLVQKFFIELRMGKGRRNSLSDWK
ncbi:hypothetical protein CsSME_00052136 [Camellia sinensis var. sinensis]